MGQLLVEGDGGQSVWIFDGLVVRLGSSEALQKRKKIMNNESLINKIKQNRKSVGELKKNNPMYKSKT